MQQTAGDINLPLFLNSQTCEQLIYKFILSYILVYLDIILERCGKRVNLLGMGGLDIYKWDECADW